MAVLSKLKTRDLLIKRNIAVPPSCGLCDSSMESHHHLFVSCPYTKTIWRKLEGILSIPPRPANSILEFAEGFCGTVNGILSDLSTVKRITFTTCIWNIWKERNYRIFQGKASTSDILLQSIIKMISSRCVYLCLSLPSPIESHLGLPPALGHTPIIQTAQVCRASKLCILHDKLHTAAVLEIVGSRVWGVVVASDSILQGLTEILNLPDLQLRGSSLCSEPRLRKKEVLDGEASDWKNTFTVKKITTQLAKFGIREVEGLAPCHRSMLKKVIDRKAGQQTILQLSSSDLDDFWS